MLPRNTTSALREASESLGSKSANTPSCVSSVVRSLTSQPYSPAQKNVCPPGTRSMSPVSTPRPRSTAYSSSPKSSPTGPTTWTVSKNDAAREKCTAEPPIIRSRSPNGVLTASKAIEPTTVSDMRRASLASLLAATVLAAIAPPAGALPDRFGKGPGYCSRYGNRPSAYRFEGVYACASTQSAGTTPFDAAGDESFQCVELSARFLWAIYGIWAGPGTGVESGADLVGVVHRRYPRLRVGFPAP